MLASRPLVLVGSLVLGLLAACGSERPLPNPDLEGRLAPLPTGAVWYGERVLVDGALTGAIGRDAAVDGPARVRTFGEGAFTGLELARTTSAGAVMHLLELDGGLDHPALVPGARLVFEGAEPPERDDAFTVVPMACSGEVLDAWELDVIVERTELEVEEGPWAGSRRFDWTLWQAADPELGIPADVSRGSVVLADPEALGL